MRNTNDVIKMDNSVVAIAISGSKKSKYIIRWALENLVQEGHISFKLIHVFPEIKTVPTPMGNGIPITQVREDIAAAFRKEVEYQTTEKILPYKMLCIKKQVPTDVVKIESDNVVDAISEEIAKCNINKLVIGTSSTGGMFSSSYWIQRGQNMSSRISEACPSFCTVYAVSKGKLLSVRPSDPEARLNNREETTVEDIRFSNHSPSYAINSQPAVASDWSAQSSPAHPQFLLPISPTEKYQPVPSNSIEIRTNPNDNRSLSYNSIGEENDAMLSNHGSSDFSDQKSNLSGSRSFTTEIHSWTSTDQSSSLITSSAFSSGSQVNINFELEQLRMELKHVQKMYAKAQTDALNASLKLNDLHQQRFEESIKLKEISLREEEAKELAEKEKAKYEAAMREAEIAKQCTEKEAALKIAAETNAIRGAKARHTFEDTLSGPSQHFQEFSWEEITSATLSFSDDLKVGMGSYGTVYKCTLRHTTAAVKVLHSLAANRAKQFQQEIEILSKIRHPNLLTLLGACPERCCLVYEYMENGSLEERLLHRKPPIPWYERFRIAREVASALIFLHSSKPKPIIHRDLKPANILLDHNLASKIGDVGLSTMLHSETTTMYKDTSPVGTLCYIDPEYQRTCLVSPKSDVYAFGIVILQLLTAKPAMGLARKMETALGDDRLECILDPEAGDWPLEEAKEMAFLALKCAELRHGDRPDLESEVLPALDELKIVADNARGLLLSGPTGPPGHFICPLLKDVMNNPCVAADGYSYDRKAIEEWLEEYDASPVTSLPLVHKSLVPNYTLLSAITNWKSGKR